MKLPRLRAKYFLGSVLLVVLSYVGIIAFPQPMFAYHIGYRNFEIWSDRPISPQVNQVLDDANRRLATSDLYDKNNIFTIFICNAPWRLWLYGQHFNSRIGGNADMFLTRNVYIRASDIVSNRIYSPGGVPLADARQRPLSYFIAHEATHVIESQQFGRLASARYPKWLIEGYADYVGKGGDFNFDENFRLYKVGDAKLDFKKSGLYREFHLKVSLLLDKKGKTVRQIFSDPPAARDVDSLLENYSVPEAAVADEGR